MPGKRAILNRKVLIYNFDSALANGGIFDVKISFNK